MPHKEVSMEELRAMWEHFRRSSAERRRDLREALADVQTRLDAAQRSTDE